MKGNIIAAALAATLLGVTAGATLAAVPTAERDALVALYHDTNGDAWIINTNWLVGDPCENHWFGVYCDQGNSTVKRLFFWRSSGEWANNLQGSLPAQLGDLRNLETLILYDNALTGTIPPELGQLSMLQTLDLASNQLTGPLPPELGQLNNLQKLQLENNRLSGAVPPELGNLASVETLWLMGNQLQGRLPDELLDLANLKPAGLNINANALFVDAASDPGLDAFLDGKSPGGDWSATQTVAPGNLASGAPDKNSVELTWDPIEYQGDGGGYRVFFGTSPGGPYPHGSSATVDKSQAGVTARGLPFGRQLYLVVRAWTDPHVAGGNSDNRNTIWSGDSVEIALTTLPDTDFDGDGLGDSADRDQCAPANTELTLPATTEYLGWGNTTLQSPLAIRNPATGTIRVVADHELQLRAPQVHFTLGGTFSVEGGATLIVSPNAMPCP